MLSVLSKRMHEQYHLEPKKVACYYFVMKINFKTLVVSLCCLYLLSACDMKNQDAKVEGAGADAGKTCAQSTTDCGGKIDNKPAIQYYRQFFYAEQAVKTQKQILRK